MENPKRRRRILEGKRTKASSSTSTTEASPSNNTNGNLNATPIIPITPPTRQQQISASATPSDSTVSTPPQSSEDRSPHLHLDPLAQDQSLSSDPLNPLLPNNMNLFDLMSTSFFDLNSQGQGHGQPTMWNDIADPTPSPLQLDLQQELNQFLSSSSSADINMQPIPAPVPIPPPPLMTTAPQDISEEPSESDLQNYRECLFS